MRIPCHHQRAAAVPFLFVALVIASVGCGKSGSSKPTAHLQGKVTIGGSSLPENAEGSITFRPTTGDQASMTTVTIQDSRYDAPEAPMGSVRVSFSIQRPTGRTFDTGRGAPQIEYDNILPAKSAEGFDLDVTGDKADQDFDL